MPPERCYTLGRLGCNSHLWFLGFLLGQKNTKNIKTWVPCYNVQETFFSVALQALEIIAENRTKHHLGPWRFENLSVKLDCV